MVISKAGFLQISQFDSHLQACDLIQLPIRFDSILIILDIYQVQYMPNFPQGKKKNLSSNAVKYT